MDCPGFEQPQSCLDETRLKLARHEDKERPLALLNIASDTFAERVEMRQVCQVKAN